jgi:hypothetical protein
LKHVILALVLSVASGASAAEVRPGVGLGAGALPESPSSLLLSPRFDLQVDGGDRTVAFFAAVRFGTSLIAPKGMFVPTVELGARWYVSREITVGLGIAGGLAVFFAAADGSVFLAGMVIEPITWAITAHHEVGLTVLAMLPASPGAAFSVLVLPTAGYTYRF